MNYTDLEQFRVAATLGSLSKASQKLFISQPGLSRNISRLEDDLGIQLFVHRKGKLELTLYGQLLAATLNQSHEIIEHGIGQIRQLQNDNNNILTIACMIDDFMVDRLKDFSMTHPTIKIRQASGTQEELEKQLLQRSLDLAICAHPFKHKKIHFELLSHCPHVLLVNQSNPLAKKVSADFSDLENELFICENPRFNRPLLEQTCSSHGFIPKISHEVENGYILFNLLESTEAVSIVPYAYYRAIKIKFPENHLRMLSLPDDTPDALLGVAYLPESYLSPSALEFIDFLREFTETETNDH